MCRDVKCDVLVSESRHIVCINKFVAMPFTRYIAYHTGKEWREWDWRQVTSGSKLRRGKRERCGSRWSRDTNFDITSRCGPEVLDLWWQGPYVVAPWNAGGFIFHSPIRYLGYWQRLSVIPYFVLSFLPTTFSHLFFHFRVNKKYTLKANYIMYYMPPWEKNIYLFIAIIAW